MLAGAREDVEHAIDPLVIAECERIVEDYGRRPPLIKQEPRECKSRQNRDLLLGTITEALKVLPDAIARERLDGEIFVEDDVSPGQKHTEVGFDAARHWTEVFDLSFRLGGSQSAEQELQYGHLLLVVIYFGIQAIEVGIGCLQRFIETDSLAHFD